MWCGAFIRFAASSISNGMALAMTGKAAILSMNNQRRTISLAICILHSANMCVYRVNVCGVRREGASHQAQLFVNKGKNRIKISRAKNKLSDK